MNLLKVVKWTWIVALVGATVYAPLSNDVWMKMNKTVFLYVFNNMTLGLLLKSAVAALAVQYGFRWLKKTFPVMGWGLFKTNVQLMPAGVKYLGPVFILFFAMSVPALASLEEWIFRQGTLTWQDAVVLSALFGVVHLTAGVPVGGCVMLAVFGGFLTHQYFTGGLGMAIAVHTTYNLLLLMLVMSKLLRRDCGSMRADLRLIHGKIMTHVQTQA